MPHLLDGRAMAQRIREKIKQRIADQQLNVGLGVILVGDDPASHLYVSLKQKACEEAGIRFEKKVFLGDASDGDIIEKINEWNGRGEITGILVQLPLPSQDTDAIIGAIDPWKDVDGFHPENLAALEEGRPGIASALGLGIMKLFVESGAQNAGKTVIIGSRLFARSLTPLLRERSIVPAVLSPTDPSLAEKTKTADVLIVAVGQPNLISSSMVKPGAIVIDVGTTKVDGKIVGDVDFQTVSPLAGAITPVPGGVGPMTVACLLMNILRAHQLQKSREIRT
ncbi:bifunctional methylenetetrahydrofolate dehydrogenase/methenyltetrahydrofolate cyclohydrolase [Candidatus Uhrbacteria bacterium]|nr:bifunctional methylenetetrahydrofolate dehydrogenase/methenyltetrahydrofolate cyclohydrolase [Candidatus Uhrbacteria bacterium]